MEGALERALRHEDFAVVTADQSVTRAADFHVWIRGARSILRAQGVGPGDRVVYCGDQSLDAFIWFWACVCSGAVFVPLAVDSTLHQYRWCCERLAARLAIADAHEANAAIETASSAASVLPSTAYRTGSVRADLSESPVTGDSLAACLLTSGSTGEPKVVMLSRDALAASAERACTHFGWRPRERLLNLPAPHTMSGLRNGFIAAPLGGLQWNVSPRRERADIGSLLALLERARAQHVVAAPILIRQLNLLGERVSAAALNATRAFYCTGTDLNGAEVRAFHERFGIPVINYYGLTETVGLCVAQHWSDWTPDDVSIGRAVQCEVRIVDDELWIRQALPMSGYLDDVAATAAVFDEGWFRTGDRARIDDSGRIYITGRLGTFIKTLETDKVSPVEVEAILESHGSIREAAVCGVADRAGGERIAALLVVKDGMGSPQLQRDVRRFVAERLGEARVPSLIRWIEVLPRTSSGKIQRSQLASYFDA